MKKKSLAMVLALVLVLSVAVVGVVAWLTDETDSIENTFTVGDINITLDEKAGKDAGYQFKMVPGNTIKKDPIVTVQADSEDCYLYVKLEKSGNFDSFLTYAMATGWEPVEGTTNVYVRTVKATDAVKSFSVLSNDQVVVKGDVTKVMLNGLTAETYPTLTVTAYAVQLHNGSNTDWTAAQAWAANFGE